MHARLCLVWLPCLALGGCGRLGYDPVGDEPSGDRCAAEPDADTLLLYTFSESGAAVLDQTGGGHDGTVVGTGAARVSGEPDCGPALAFSVTDPISYLEVPDAPEWQLTEGSFDLWIRPPAGMSQDAGIVTRDAVNTTEAGHIALTVCATGAVLLRIQSDSMSFNRCSEPLALDAWHHVGVNFGPGGLELVVDGEIARVASSTACSPTPITCDDTVTFGIAGNSNPWVLGASSMLSADGLAIPVDLPYEGLIDSFRVSRVRRVFR